MRIWTTQTKQLWEALKRDGFVTCCDSLISRAFPEQYGWMVEQMDRRIGPSPSPGVHFPLWGWYQVGSYKKELHPNPGACWGECKDWVFLTLEMPDDKVLLSEYTLWEAGPLSGLYLPQGMKDEDSDDPALRRASWEIIFNIDAQTRFSPRKRRNKLIQACFWEIKMDWVERAIPFHHAGFYKGL